MHDPSSRTAPADIPRWPGQLAAIDMGSNSFRLEIGQLIDGRYRRIDYLKETVRLGAGLDADGLLTDAARAWLGRVGYDPVYGARPLKRAVQRYLQDPLADLILRGDVKDGSTVKVDEGDGKLELAVS